MVEYEKVVNSDLSKLESYELMALLDDLVQQMTGCNNTEWVHHEGNRAFNKLTTEISNRMK